MKILVIDDDSAIRNSVRDFLEDCDREVLLAANGQEALDLLQARDDIGVALVDLNMPVMDGYTFLSKVRESRPGLPTVVLSGVGVLSDAMAAIRAGAWDFISKPILNFDVLLHSISSVEEKARLLAENRAYQEHLEEMVRQRTMQLEIANERVIHCLGKAAEFRDNDTGHHVIRVGEIARILATHMGLDQDFRRLIRLAAPMHDIGKISIPDHILLKPGPLSDEEWEVMKRHTILGCEMLHFNPEDAKPGCTLDLLNLLEGQDDLISMAQRIALCHHERWDGLGYPHGLRGDEIPLEARIVSVVDVYDALGSMRPYKKAIPEDVCKAKIIGASGKYFDPAVVEAFERHYDEVAEIRRKYAD
ncbi:HD-GYP domain-containing protein [Fundidesulfovibrio agrisoli]|uniref:HD-GYP domain-containing protein n=1 Tax=Fundidesulfovibrio agrisoli TaxID=2922717 RepID=UPI001FAD4BC8|nr:HD domain-containing phosphohydrolase [Fundidesulfovibrio agrisoli]